MRFQRLFPVASRIICIFCIFKRVKQEWRVIVGKNSERRERVIEGLHARGFYSVLAFCEFPNLLCPQLPPPPLPPTPHHPPPTAPWIRSTASTRVLCHSGCGVHLMHISQVSFNLMEEEGEASSLFYNCSVVLSFILSQWNHFQILLHKIKINFIPPLSIKTSSPA